ncbi:MAG: DUF1295 domain-containing protein [Sphaerochaetaceae bacterium]
MNRRSHSRSFAMRLLACCYLVAFLVAAVAYRFLPIGMTVLAKTFIADIVATIVVFCFSRWVDNSSLYDPYWSVAPPVLYAVWLRNVGIASFLIFAMVAAMLFWSVRLTVNCISHWGGLQDEDWRYVSFREKLGAAYWPVSFLGIHLFPTLIVFACSLPMWSFMALSRSSMRSAFALVGIVFVLFGTVLELVADRQMSRFQRERASQTECCISGLWGLCRHPNYLGELSVWWGVCIASFANSDTPLWFVVFPCAMTAMFFGYSIPAMEKRQLTRRPCYRQVRRSVPMLFPRLRGRKR